MKRITFFIMLLTVLWSVKAQHFNDSTCTSTFEDISSSGTALGLVDDGEVAITLPFDFTLTGVTSRDLLVSNNGAVLFGVTSGNVSAFNTELTSNSAKPGFYPFWDDIDDDAGDVYWEVKGTAPNRYLVIEWYQRPHYRNIGDATFELILYEGTNEVEFRYQDIVFGNSSYDYGASATIGIKGQGGVYQYSYNTPLDSTVTCIHWTPPAVYNPVAEASVRPDCNNQQLFLDVNIMDMGGADSLSVSDDQGNVVQPVDSIGTVVMGPYPDSTTVTVTISNMADSTYAISFTKDLYCVSGNDECQYAYELTVYPQDSSAGHETLASTEHASASQYSITSCDTYGPNYDLFFTFTAPASGYLKILTDSTRGSYIKAVVRQSCDTAEVACFGSSSEKIVRGLTPGQTYILQVWTDSHRRGTFTIALEELNYVNPEFETTIQPDCANNQFSVDIRVTDLGGSTSVTVADDQGSPTQQVTDTATVVQFGPYADGTEVTFTVTSDDDTTYVATQTVQYYCPPANDSCGSATELTIYPTCTIDTFTNAGATDSGIPDPGCANYQGGDVWFYITAPSDLDTLTIKTVVLSGSNFDDSGLAVYTGTCDSLTLVECNDDGNSNDYSSEITLTNVSSGTQYYIRVWEYGNNEIGEMGICVYSPNISVHNSLSPEEFTFYPNPTRSTISWKADGTVDRLQITGITGQVLISVDHPETTSLDISRLPKGIYLLNIWMNDKKGVYRVIKE